MPNIEPSKIEASRAAWEEPEAFAADLLGMLVDLGSVRGTRARAEDAYPSAFTAAATRSTWASSIP